MLRVGNKKRLKEAWLAKTPKYFFHDHGAACGIVSRVKKVGEASKMKSL